MLKTKQLGPHLEDPDLYQLEGSENEEGGEPPVDDQLHEPPCEAD